MNLVILGPQGCGKGTQAKLLAEKFGINHISSGALLRAEAESGSEKGKIIAELLAKGTLLPFDTVLDLVDQALASSPMGFVLDGTPRDVRQAEHLDWFLATLNKKIDKVIFLNIPPEESLRRLSKRAQIEGRADDTPEAIKKRLDIYHTDTIPVIDYYRQKNLVLDIDGTPDIETIHADISARLT